MNPRQIQNSLLLSAAFLYILTAALLVPGPHRPMAVVGGVLFPLMWWGAKRMTGVPGGPEVAGVSFINAFAFLIFVAKDIPGSHWLSFAIGCFGALTATGIWVVQRFDFRPPPSASLASRIIHSVRFGMLVALVLSMIATVPLVIVILSDSSKRRGELFQVALLVYGAYFAAGLVIGLMVGLLRPIAHWALGRLLLGFLGGVAIYAAVGPAVTLIDRLGGKGTTEASILMGIAMLAGLIVGPGGAFAFGDSPVGPAA